MSGLKRVIAHWAVTKYKATDLAKEHYHFIVEGDGKVVAGKFAPEANIKPKSGAYAAHTLNCNTGSIGISCAAMADAKSVKEPGPYPITEVQFDAMCRKIAELCRKYDIPVTLKTVLSHAEVEANLGIKQRGKWDIAVLPFAKLSTAKSCGDLMRRKVSDFMTAKKAEQPFPALGLLSPTPGSAMAMSLGDKGPVVAELKRNLNELGYGPLTENDEYDEATKAEVAAFQAGHKDEDGNALKADGIAGHRTSKAIAAALLAPKLEQAEKEVPASATAEVKEKTGWLGKVTGWVTGAAAVGGPGVASEVFGADYKTILAVGALAIGGGLAVGLVLLIARRWIIAAFKDINAEVKGT